MKTRTGPRGIVSIDLEPCDAVSVFVDEITVGSTCRRDENCTHMAYLAPINALVINIPKDRLYTRADGKFLIRNLLNEDRLELFVLLGNEHLPEEGTWGRDEYKVSLQRFLSLFDDYE